jgi:biotin carboxylase
MRRVMTREELPAALAAGSAEALAAFGDGAVYLEREVRPARHIEVQLLGDAMDSADGPTKTSPAASTARANDARSARKP